MKEYTHEIKTEGLRGWVKVNVPSFRERLAMLKELGINVSGDGASFGDVGDLGVKALDKVNELLVDMEVFAGEVKFTKENLGEFEYYTAFNEFLAEMQGLLFNGISLGKPKNAQ